MAMKRSQKCMTAQSEWKPLKNMAGKKIHGVLRTEFRKRRQDNRMVGSNVQVDLRSTYGGRSIQQGLWAI